jgi:hypothetical protein
MRFHKSALLLILLLFALPLTLEAKGSFNKIVITDKNTGAALDVSDREALHPFLIFDWKHGWVHAPETTGSGYAIRRGWLIDGKETFFDLVVYYPSSPGYIYYAGLLTSDGKLCDICSEYDGGWYLLDPEVDAELQAIIRNMPQTPHHAGPFRMAAP